MEEYKTVFPHFWPDIYTYYTYRQVNGDDVAEPLLVLKHGGEVGNKHDEDGGEVDGHDVAENVPAQADNDGDAFRFVFAVEDGVGDVDVVDKVLGELHRAAVVDLVLAQEAHVVRVLRPEQGEVHEALLFVDRVVAQLVGADEGDVVGAGDGQLVLEPVVAVEVLRRAQVRPGKRQWEQIGNPDIGNWKTGNRQVVKR